MQKLRVIDVVYMLAIIALGVLYINEKFIEKKQFKEIDVERINVVGEDGNKYIVLSCPKRQALATMNHKPIDPEQERDVPGLLFFNQQGDEIGGLIYHGDDSSSFQMLTFDQYKNDQIMCMRKDEYKQDGKWNRRYGLTFQERFWVNNMDSVMNVYRELTKIENEEERNNAIDELFSDPSLRVPFRMFLGRTFKGSNGLFLYDDQSRTRARFYIDKNNNAKLQFFDENGKKVYQIPESK